MNIYTCICNQTIVMNTVFVLTRFVKGEYMFAFGINNFYNLIEKSQTQYMVLLLYISSYVNSNGSFSSNEHNVPFKVPKNVPQLICMSYLQD